MLNLFAKIIPFYLLLLEIPKILNKSDNCKISGITMRSAISAHPRIPILIMQYEALKLDFLTEYL